MALIAPIIWRRTKRAICSPAPFVITPIATHLTTANLIHYWHGWGGFIDYTNPNALIWWHSQLDNVINLGIDGWKTDGTDPFLFEMGGTSGFNGSVSERDYANSYYRDFFYYTKQKNPNALISMFQIRPLTLTLQCLALLTALRVKSFGLFRQEMLFLVAGLVIKIPHLMVFSLL